MKSTEEFIKDMFTSRREAVGGKILGINPFQRLVIFFLILIGLGSLLLMLPGTTPASQPLDFIDAIFTATSAICVTGLLVRDTATAFSPFGQIIILILIKIGGLGYMILASAAVILIGRKLTINDRQTLKHAMNLETAEGMRHFIRRVLLISLSFEFLGGIIISKFYLAEHGFLKALGLGFFHSISGFNNAGFCLFSDNLMSQTNQPVIIITIMLLALIGGLGFFIINEFIDLIRKKRRRLSVHTKIVLTTTVVLLIIGALSIWFTTESNIGQSFFLSSIAKTAGFNIQNTGSFCNTTLFLLIPQMFIGASPGGTGGGIKTTTFALVVLSVWATLRGRGDVVTYHRRIGSDTILKALTVGMTMGVLLVVISLLLIAIEGFDLIKVLFEVTSALGTVGLSVGDGGNASLSALFSVPGKILIMIAMFIGRLGPVTLGLAAAFQVQHPQLIKYPEGRVSIG